MKQHNMYKIIILLVFSFGITAVKLQAQDSTAPATILALRYFLPANKLPYLEVSTKKKNGRKLEPVKAIPVNVYLGEVNETNLLGKTITGAEGLGRIIIPPSFKAVWDTTNSLHFLAVSEPVKGEEDMTADITIKKAILVIDTLSVEGVRTVTAILKEKSGSDWIPVKDIEMKLSIKRSLGNLTVGEAETYTADSTGLASAAFIKDSMPADKAGNIVLVASVEDNDDYGNLAVEKHVSWGKPVISTQNNFWHRSLWSTGNRAPFWLLIIALSIIGGVWGVIIYLITQIIKIKKLGKEPAGQKWDKKQINQSGTIPALN
ncbi:MAG: hypothetical protein ABIY51_02755 [Ferruginibacter sp.]